VLFYVFFVLFYVLFVLFYVIFVVFYEFFVLFYVFFCVVLCTVCLVSFPVLFGCICVLNYCHRVPTQLQLNISYHMDMSDHGQLHLSKGPGRLQKV
jgi:hypothetical protein